MRVLARSYFALLLYVSTAAAQTAGLTDNDLLAAYCLGVHQSRVVALPQLALLYCGTEEAATKCRQDLAPWLAATLEEADGIRKRFARYIIARGFTTNPELQEHLPRIAAATKIGQKDYENCRTTLRQDPCMEKCRDTTGQCFNQCRTQLPTCVRVDRCGRQDIVP